MYLRSFFDRARSHLAPRKALIEVGISQVALLHNLHTYQAQYPGITFAPVLKSNAYGHDMGIVARALDRERIAFFMVDSTYEARKLRTIGIRSRILVMGYARPEEIADNAIRATDYALVDQEQARVLARLAKRPVRLHLKIDTGMHRHGILPEKLPETIATIKSNPNLHIVGVCSHFADADNPDAAFTEEQLKRWLAALDLVLAAFPKIEYRHLAATKGAAYAVRARTNVGRLGIGLYGFDTAPGGETPLEPVLEMRSVIGSLRKIEPGESVGYNATYTAHEPTLIATVPAGYYEGVDRRLSGKGTVLIKGRVCPIIGRVSMNMLSADVTEVSNVAVGDTVTVISRDGEAPNSVANIARLVSTPDYRETAYVILTHIPQHLKRVVE